MSGYNPLAAMDRAGRRLMQDCDTCPDVIACVECHTAKPLYEARAAVAELVAAARLSCALDRVTDGLRAALRHFPGAP